MLHFPPRVPCVHKLSSFPLPFIHLLGLSLSLWSDFLLSILFTFILFACCETGFYYIAHATLKLMILPVYDL